MKTEKLMAFADRILRKRFFVIIPLLLLALAGWLWIRPTTITPFANHGITFDNENGTLDVGARPEWCETLQKSGGYLLFTGFIELKSPELIQGFFQTDEEEFGIFYDFDDGPRIGLALSNGDTSRHQIGTGFDLQKINFVIMIDHNNSITYIENSKRVKFNLDDINPSCNSVKIGTGNESLPFTGNISVSISSGTNFLFASEKIEAYDSQFHSFRVRAYGLSKNSLIVALILLTLGNPFKRRGPARPLVETKSD